MQVAVCSTSNERSVGQVVNVLIGGEAAPKIKIYAGAATLRISGGLTRNVM